MRLHEIVTTAIAEKSIAHTQVPSLHSSIYMEIYKTEERHCRFLKLGRGIIGINLDFTPKQKISLPNEIVIIQELNLYTMKQVEFLIEIAEKIPDTILINIQPEYWKVFKDLMHSGKSMKALADKMNLSRERIRQIVREVMDEIGTNCENASRKQHQVIRIIRVYKDKISQLEYDLARLKKLPSLSPEPTTLVEKQTQLLSTSIQELDLPIRIKHISSWGVQVKTLGDLINMSVQKMRAIRNLGAKTIRDLADSLAHLNIIYNPENDHFDFRR